MPARTFASLAAALLLLQPLAATAQGTVTPVPTQSAALPPDQAPRSLYSKPQLDRLLAPVALYPDPLLTQMLMAAEYPAEVAEANAWVKEPEHAGLKGDELAAALEPVDWDPAVKSLVPFPDALALMVAQPEWTRQVGEAFAAQQADVMDAVQRLRRAAQVAGHLQSSDRLTVTPSGDTITIMPASPEIVYVPVYDPYTVYGPWPYPDYPPYAFAGWPGSYVAPAVYGGIGFGAGYVIVRRFWDWHACDWRHRRIIVDPVRVAIINQRFVARDHWRMAQHGWAFDPHHRRGVAFAGAAHMPSVPSTSSAPWRQQSVRPAQLSQNPGFIPMSPPASIEERQIPITPPTSIQRRDRRPPSTTAVPAPSTPSAPSSATTSAPAPRQFHRDHRDGERRALPPPVTSAPGFQNAPTTHFQNAPTTQFRNAPTTQFQNAPTTQFRSTGALPAPLPRAHVAPSAPTPPAHVAPSAPVPPSHVAPSAPAPSSNNGNGHHRRDR